jgi:hypothetical protein
LKEHKDARLSEIFEENEQIEARIGDFEIDCVLDEETQVKIMSEITWEALRKSATIPSLRGIRLFKGKLVNLCGKLARIPVTVNGTSTKEDFKIIKFIGNNAPFTMLLGKPWIERDQARKKEEEKVLEQQKRELKDFMTRRIAQLIKEHEDKSKLVSARSSDVEATKALEDPQKTGVSVSNINKVVTLRLS